MRFLRPFLETMQNYVTGRQKYEIWECHSREI